MDTTCRFALLGVVAAQTWPLRLSEAKVPASFDCGMRQLAYDFGRRLQPRHGNFSSLYFALGLNEDCTTEVADSSLEESTVIARPVPSGSIFVDPVHGRDKNNGTEEAPLLTVHAAFREVRAYGTVVLREGTHFLNETLDVGPQLVGVTLRGYPGETPVVSGGVKLDVTWSPHNVSGWSRFEDTTIVYGASPDNRTVRSYGRSVDADACLAACDADDACMGWTWHNASQGRWAQDCWGRLDGAWPARLQAGHMSGRRGAASNIYRANVFGQMPDAPGLQLDGVRATRARYPNLPGGIEVPPGRHDVVRGSMGNWTPSQWHQHADIEESYYADPLPEHLRNSSGSFRQYVIGSGGYCDTYDPPASYWCSKNPVGGARWHFKFPAGVTPKVGALPNAPYADTSQMIVNAWQHRRWENWMFDVAKYDPLTGNITFGLGGFQGARGSGGEPGGDFFVENLFEELDYPGEYFFNRTTGDLFLYYNGSGPPPADMEVVVPQLRTLVNISGTRADPVRNFTITGVSFVAARYTYMDPHGVLSGGDWSLDRIGAVFLQDTEGVVIKSSNFERLDGNGVFISGYNRNTTVRDSDFAFIGGNAIAAWGYTNETATTGYPSYTPLTNWPAAGIDGTDGNHPRHTAILRNLVREVGLYEKQSSFFVQAKTALTTLAENVFFNGPRAGINFNDGFGGGDVLERNLVFSTCRESGDHGPFNSWDRQPYLTDVSGEPSTVTAWREIRNNFLIDNYSPQENIDNDDGSGYYEAHHNFLVYGGNGMKTDYGGHDMRHHDNIYAYAGHVLGICGTKDGHEDYFYSNRCVLTSERVGGCLPSVQMHDNRYFTASGNLTECKLTLPDVQAQGKDANSTVEVLPADHDILSWARELLSMPALVAEAEAEVDLI